MLKLQIIRLQSDDKQTLGQGYVFDGLDKVFEFKTLELPWLDNQRNISCIRAGKYKVEKRISPKFGWTFHIKNVRERSHILIHSGNYYTQIRGCILVGKKFTDINDDGCLDVNDSVPTIVLLLEIMPDDFDLNISRL